MLHFRERYLKLISKAMQIRLPFRGILHCLLLVAAFMHPLPLAAQDGDGGGGGGVDTTPTGSQRPAYGTSGPGGAFDDGSFNANIPGIGGVGSGVLDGRMDPRASLFDSNVRQSRRFLYSGGFREEDRRYRDDDLQGTNDVYGSQANRPIPHKSTPLISPLKLSEWYYISMQNPSSPEMDAPEDKLLEIRNQAGPDSPYIGPLYRGTYNLFRYNSRLNQPTQGDDRTTTCKRMVESMSAGRDARNPEWQRLEMDNCTNQYILQQNARYSNMIHEQQSEVPGLSPETCQPLTTVPLRPNEEEYAADWYYVVAWEKLLSNSDFLARDGKAKLEPNYGNGPTPHPHKIRITNPIPRPNTFGWTFLRDLASAPASGQNMGYERIMDPSHPFSPRWDFEDNDRDKYSRYTLLYRYGDGMNTVRCSGGAGGNNTIKVDLMKWREQRFDRHVMSRLAFNIMTYPLRCGPVRCWRLWRCDRVGFCCSTEWDRADVVRTSWCNFRAGGDSNLTMRQLCEATAKPVVPVNVLKMRKADSTNFPKGVPAGYRYKDYFGKNRPYMRCWDTGQECGLEDGTSFEEAMQSDEGSEYAIMGAGREGRDGKSESCLMGGSEGRLNVPTVSPITDWMELKLYQVNAMRRGLFCLPRNEIVNKYGDSEQLVLNMSGAAVQMRVPNPEDGQMNRYTTVPWPKAWRGYVQDVEPSRRFPFFGGGSPSLSTGLDEARPGEVLVFDEEVVMSGSPRNEGATTDDRTWRLPFVAYVTAANNEYSRTSGGDGSAGGGSSDTQDFVRVVAHNHGKFPDACGNTQDMYMGESFTMYKDELPNYIKQRLDRVGHHTTSCADPAMNDCVESQWSRVKRYNIQEDVRE